MNKPDDRLRWGDIVAVWRSMHQFLRLWLVSLFATWLVFAIANVPFRITTWWLAGLARPTLTQWDLAHSIILFLMTTTFCAWIFWALYQREKQKDGEVER